MMSYVLFLCHIMRLVMHQHQFLFVLGNTKVLCSINMQPNVPPFLKGSKSGWVTAEYAMLPAATHMRTSRESTSVKRNGRAIEISRLIGRCFTYYCRS